VQFDQQNKPLFWRVNLLPVELTQVKASNAKTERRKWTLLNVGDQVMTKFISMLKDDTGAAAAEYALILAIIGGAIAAAALALGGEIGNSMNSAAKCIKDGVAASC
jgi:pilus assembly protein Flp/PilA